MTPQVRLGLDLYTSDALGNDLLNNQHVRSSLILATEGHFHLERLKGVALVQGCDGIFSLRYSQAGRIILFRDGHRFFVVDILTNHEYDKLNLHLSATIQRWYDTIYDLQFSIEAIPVNEWRATPTPAQENINGENEEEDIIDYETRALWYAPQRPIVLTENQYKTLNTVLNKTGTSLIEGLAGTGKTVTASAAMTYASGTGLYIAPSPELCLAMQQRAIFNGQQVTCLTPWAFILKHHPRFANDPANILTLDQKQLVDLSKAFTRSSTSKFKYNNSQLASALVWFGCTEGNPLYYRQLTPGMTDTQRQAYWSWCQYVAKQHPDYFRLVSQNHFLAWCDKTKDPSHKSTISRRHKDELWYEFTILSRFTSLDHYLNAGERETLIPKSERQDIADLYRSYKSHLDIQNLISPELGFTLSGTIVAQYDCIWADEIQHRRMLGILPLIQSMVKTEGQCVLLGDSSQQLGLQASNTSLHEIIKSILTNEKITSYSLGQCLRLPAQVLKLCGQLDGVSKRLLKDKQSPVIDVSPHPSSQNSAINGHAIWTDINKTREAIGEIASNPDAMVLHWKAISSNHNIPGTDHFAIPQCGGLEARYVIIYLSGLPIEIVKAINDPQNHSADPKRIRNVLRLFRLAFTRTRERLVIAYPGLHPELSKLFETLGVNLTNNSQHPAFQIEPEDAAVLKVKWLQKAYDYCISNDFDRARTIFINHLGYKSSDVDTNNKILSLVGLSELSPTKEEKKKPPLRQRDSTTTVKPAIFAKKPTNKAPPDLKPNILEKLRDRASTALVINAIFENSGHPGNVDRLSAKSMWELLTKIDDEFSYLLDFSSKDDFSNILLMMTIHFDLFSYRRANPLIPTNTDLRKYIKNPNSNRPLMFYMLTSPLSDQWKCYLFGEGYKSVVQPRLEAFIQFFIQYHSKDSKSSKICGKSANKYPTIFSECLTTLINKVSPEDLDKIPTEVIASLAKHFNSNNDNPVIIKMLTPRPIVMIPKSYWFRILIILFMGPISELLHGLEIGLYGAGSILPFSRSIEVLISLVLFLLSLLAIPAHPVLKIIIKLQIYLFLMNLFIVGLSVYNILGNSIKPLILAVSLLSIAPFVLHPHSTKWFATVVPDLRALVESTILMPLKILVMLLTHYRLSDEQLAHLDDSLCLHMEKLLKANDIDLANLSPKLEYLFRNNLLTTKFKKQWGCRFIIKLFKRESEYIDQIVKKYPLLYLYCYNEFQKFIKRGPYHQIPWIPIQLQHGIVPNDAKPIDDAAVSAFKAYQPCSRSDTEIIDLLKSDISVPINWKALFEQKNLSPEKLLFYGWYINHKLSGEALSKALNHYTQHLNQYTTKELYVRLDVLIKSQFLCETLVDHCQKNNLRYKRIVDYLLSKKSTPMSNHEPNKGHACVPG